MRINNNQKGISLIELILAIAIMGILGTGITMTITQSYAADSMVRNKNQAIKQVQYSVDYINRDIKQSEPAVLSTSYEWEDGTPLWNGATLTFEQPFYNPQYSIKKVSYYLYNQNLVRQESIEESTGPPQVIATNIIIFTVAPANNAFSITAEVSGYKTTQETRKFTLMP